MIRHQTFSQLCLAVCLMALSACSSASSAVGQVPAATSTTAPTAAPTLPPEIYAPVLIARGFGCPDDLVIDAQGRIVFSDLGNGTVDRILASGQIVTLARGLDQPEGFVLLPDGTIIVGEQGQPGEHIDRIDRVPPGSTTPDVLVAFHNATGMAGLDSLSLDPRTSALLVPDSPNGTILRVSLDGTQIQAIASGFVRPVDALADASGNIFVADEYGNEVARIAPDGTVTRLASLPAPDDLAFDLDGTLLVTALGTNTLVRLDPATGKTLATVAANLFGPQGLGVDARGNLYISEENANAVIELVRGRSTPGVSLPGASGIPCG
jgi:sugar lactone lactonase YvrE